AASSALDPKEEAISKASRQRSRGVFCFQGPDRERGADMAKAIATDTASQPATMRGADLVCVALERCGVDVVFGYPGGASLPIHDAFPDHPGIHHVLVRHEQGAAHMADGYARVTGRPGVCLVTSGPGATNLV